MSNVLASTPKPMFDGYPPRRMSVAEGAEDYDYRWPWCRVSLDGVDQPTCLAYNQDEGWVNRYPLHGQPFQSPEYAHGVVTVRWLNIGER